MSSKLSFIAKGKKKTDTTLYYGHEILFYPFLALSQIKLVGREFEIP